MNKIEFWGDASKLGMPYFEIKGEGFDHMLMLVDTGSTNNILFDYVYEQVKDVLKPVEGEWRITGINGKVEDTKCVEGNLPFFGKEYPMHFLIGKGDAGMKLTEETGLPVCGIIGTLFMVEHGWVIDFAHQEILIPETDVSVEVLRKIGNKKKEEEIPKWKKGAIPGLLYK